MSHTDDCNYEVKDFIGIMKPADDGSDQPTEFRVSVTRDTTVFKDYPTVTWYHGDLTIGTRWGNYQTEFFDSGKDDKEPLLNSLRAMRDALQEAMEYIESL